MISIQIILVAFARLRWTFYIREFETSQRNFWYCEICFTTIGHDVREKNISDHILRHAKLP